MNDLRKVPMCCGTPLKDDRCVVCHDDYRNTGPLLGSLKKEVVASKEWVMVEMTDEMKKELKRVKVAMADLKKAIGSIEISINSLETFVDSNISAGKARLYDLNEIETDVSELMVDVAEEATLFVVFDACHKAIIERREKNLPIYFDIITEKE